MEEGGSEKRQLLKLVSRDRVLEELVLGGEGEELEDELVRVGEEVVVLVDLPRLTRRLHSNSFKTRLLVNIFNRDTNLSLSPSQMFVSLLSLQSAHGLCGNTRNKSQQILTSEATPNFFEHKSPHTHSH